MAYKRPLFGGGLRAGGLHAGPEDRDPPGGREPANQSDPREAGAQRGARYPAEPIFEVDVLDDDDGGRRPGGWRSGIAIGTALAVFAGVLWYAYGWGIEQLARTRLPMIVADTTPIKSRPEDPGGIEVLHQDVAVLNDAAPDPGKPQAERLLPPPEAPRVVPAEAPPEAPLPPTSVTEVESLLGPPLETAAGPAGKIPAAEEVPPPAIPPAAPQITATVRLPEAEPEAAPETAPPVPETETLLAPEPPAIPAVSPSVPAPAPAVASEPAPQVAALPDAKTGGFVVQLAALKAKAGAAPAWARLQKAHPALLSDRELAIQRVDLGDRGIFYRVQAGFFVERAGASDLCHALKARGQDCLVVKR